MTKTQDDVLMEAVREGMDAQFEGVNIDGARELKQEIDELVKAPYDFPEYVRDIIDHDRLNGGPDGVQEYEIRSSETKSGHPEIIHYYRISLWSVGYGVYSAILRF